MSTTVSTPAAAAVRPFERKFPPVIAIGMAALTLAITGGVLLVSQIAEDPALLVPGILMGGAIVLEIVAIVILVTIRPFAGPVRSGVPLGPPCLHRPERDHRMVVQEQ